MGDNPFSQHAGLYQLPETACAPHPSRARGERERARGDPHLAEIRSPSGWARYERPHLLSASDELGGAPLVRKSAEALRPGVVGRKRE